jgi:hypothetical protein
MPKKLTGYDPSAIRKALSELPLTPAWESLTPPKPTEIYVPLLHNKALLPEVSIVEGMRGAGKSFWTAVLADDNTRSIVSGVAHNDRLAGLSVKIGFGLDLDNTIFPSAKRISALLAKECIANDIWLSVLLRHAYSALKKKPPFPDSVDGAAFWVRDNRDLADRLVGECDKGLSAKQLTLLLIFDSLDRLADDWEQIRKLLSSALQLALECRTRRAIRFKFFLRPDMVEEDDDLWRFADSSKLHHGKGELVWRPNDLFGLILLHLANSKSCGKGFRETVAKKYNLEWREVDKVFPLPSGMTAGVQPLREIVEAIAGPWMGTTAKRGFTFTWIPTHLSDAKGRLSPRSILLAFRHAAQWTEQNHPQHFNAVHYEGIQQGVVEASKIRIGEIKEDYPWVGPLLEALKGATVPLTVEELTERWTPACIRLSLKAAEVEQRLPPRRYSNERNRKSVQLLVDDLVELAVLYRTEDKRINMPDIFRVGFGIKRKGGVKPPR